MDAAGPPVSIDLAGFEEKEGLPVEAFAKVQEIFSNVDWLDPNADAALNVLQQITASNILQGSLEAVSVLTAETGSSLQDSSHEKLKSESSASENNIRCLTSWWICSNKSKYQMPFRKYWIPCILQKWVACCWIQHQEI